jgi:hypothetical protein
VSVDPLIGGSRTVRRPHPRFGVQSLKALKIKLNCVVHYVGPQQFDLLTASTADLGLVIEGPEAASQLGIVAVGVAPDDVFWRVYWSNRKDKALIDCWTMESSLKVMT